MDDIDLDFTTFLATHRVHSDLVKWGFVNEVAPGRHQVNDPQAIISAIKSSKLTGEHADLAASLLLQCKPPKGFWYAENSTDLIERIRVDLPL